MEDKNDVTLKHFKLGDVMMIIGGYDCGKTMLALQLCHGKANAFWNTTHNGFIPHKTLDKFTGEDKSVVVFEDCDGVSSQIEKFFKKTNHSNIYTLVIKRYYNAVPKIVREKTNAIVIMTAEQCRKNEHELLMQEQQIDMPLTAFQKMRDSAIEKDKFLFMNDSKFYSGFFNEIDPATYIS